MAPTNTAVAPATVDEDKSAKADTPSVSTKEYIVLDLTLYLMLDDGTGKRKTRRYHRGSTVKLEDKVAKTLTAEPRPSVILKADVDTDKD